MFVCAVESVSSSQCVMGTVRRIAYYQGSPTFADHPLNYHSCDVKLRNQLKQEQTHFIGSQYNYTIKGW